MSQSKYRQLDVRAPRGTTLTAKSWLTEACSAAILFALNCTEKCTAHINFYAWCKKER